MRFQKRSLAVLLCLMSLMLLCFGLTACGTKKYKVTLDYDQAQGSIVLSPTAQDNKYEDGTKVTVTVTAKDGYEVDTFTVSTDAKAGLTNGKYELTVSADTTVKATFKTTSVAVTEVKLDQDVLGLEVGGIEEEATATLVATVLPDNATDKEVTWTSDNPDVAEVSGGIVTAKAEGKATITATAGGKSATCIVTVTQHVHAAKDATYEIEGNTHFQLCKCGVKVNEAAHSAAEGAEWKQDTANNQHYKECVCGAHVEVAAHSAKDATYQKEDGKHYQLCVCGAKVNEAEHAAADEEEWEKDDGDKTTGKHWQICVCGERVNESAHEMDPEAFSDGEQGHHYECEKCGFKTETEAHINESGKWTQHPNFNKGHYYNCSVCEAEVTQSHTIEYYSDENGLSRRCSGCDFDAFVSAHQMTKLVSDGAGTGKHHLECTAPVHEGHGCTYKTESVSCANDEYMTWMQDAENPGNGHIGTCQCGNQVSVQPHDAFGEGGRCSKCGYLAGHTCIDNADANGYYDGVCEDCGKIVNDTWVFKNGTISTYNGSYAKIKIPKEIDSVPVTKFDGDFSNNETITDVLIPEGITVSATEATTIGFGLFYGCHNLKTVIILAKITTLPMMTFDDCTNLDWIVLPDTITSIDSMAFNCIGSGTPLKTVYFLGDAATWNSIPSLNNVDVLKDAEVLYYKAESGSAAANEWHWEVEGVIPQKWE